MGGSEFGDDWELAASARPTTLVLVGRTGNGKSATGNSILGSHIFKSKRSSSAVTSTCELHDETILDGRCIRVIDTPGLFDPSMKPDFVMKEIIRCFDLATDGVHALLLVLSVRHRFTAEEMAAVENLQAIFGDKAVNYMIVIFTGGDEFEDDTTLEDYLSDDAPELLRTFVSKCGNRKVLFDNKTKDKTKKGQQLSELMNMIDETLALNGGIPYTSELFKEARKTACREQVTELSSEEIRAMTDQMISVQLDRFRSVVEEKLRLSAERLEEKLSAEQKARKEVERLAFLDKEKSEADIRNLREELERANREREKLYEQMRNQSSCTIL